MAKIKITSNPYQKTTYFSKFNLVSGKWEVIKYENNANSILVNDDIKRGFFQFKVDEIVEGIYNDYHNATEKIELVFEGTEDDYIVLEKVCSREKYADQIVLEKSNTYLENASEVLPYIKKIFSQLEPLVEYCVTDKENVHNEIKKFTEASDDCIPVVILGNYSTGKSTFINALIGSEILPSGDEPITAKIYKISKSETDDRASIKFFFHQDQRVELNFTTKKNMFAGDQDNVIVELIKAGLEEVKDQNILVRLGKALQVVNSYENDTENQEISDLIEVVTPFNNGILSDSSSKYVIFDTPGSNSASNVRHLEVLKRAMKDMSNGIPMFISEYDSLDSTDNETLYTQIKEMAELDSRFTMIIVNKADYARLPSGGFTDAKIKGILNWSIPKNMYSEGIFFVSSIMGLGAKTNGEFQDEYYLGTYCKELDGYSNPNSRFKKCLYKYNIMPEQLKEAMEEKTSECQDLVYANSGIYSVESGLEDFAKNFSSYNKCEQSRLFLRRIIDITEEVIKDRVAKSKRDKENMIQTLEKEKAELLAAIDSKTTELNTYFDTQYSDFIDDKIQKKYTFVTADDLKNQEDDLKKKYQEELRLGDADAQLNSAYSKLGNNIKTGLARNTTQRNIARLGESIKEGIKDVQEKRSELKDTNKDIDTRVADELLTSNKSKFTAFASVEKKSIEAESRTRWGSYANQVRMELAKLVSGSSALTSEQRDQLSKIILEYGDINFDSKADEIFIKDDFLFGIKLGNIKLFELNKVRLDKLRRTFNAEMNKYINNVCMNVKNSHETSYKEWLNALLSDVRENITEYSSMLHTQLDYIKQEEEFIIDFESKQAQIKTYSSEVEDMISWKE